jgi:predicted ATP-grasp superfamily ATP-dependent carboligase
MDCGGFNKSIAVNAWNTRPYLSGAKDKRIAELEAKLAKAVEALGGMIGLFSVDNVLRKGTHLNIELSHARTTLAKLTKERSDEI